MHRGHLPVTAGFMQDGYPRSDCLLSHLYRHRLRSLRRDHVWSWNAPRDSRGGLLSHLRARSPGSVHAGPAELRDSPRINAGKVLINQVPEQLGLHVVVGKQRLRRGLQCGVAQSDSQQLSKQSGFHGRERLRNLPDAATGAMRADGSSLYEWEVRGRQSFLRPARAARLCPRREAYSVRPDCLDRSSMNLASKVPPSFRNVLTSAQAWS